MRRYIQTLTIISLISVLTAINDASAQSQKEVSQVLHGQALAETNCAQCHSVGISGESPNKSAPPFRTFSSYRSVTLIGWELMNEDWGEHRKMPQFEVTVDQVRDIVEWIRWVQPEARGKRIVQENCSTCHAVGDAGKSRHPNATPFREISNYYPVEALEQAFAEGIVSGHPDMPEFTATAEQIGAIISYLKTIQVKSDQ